MFKIDGEITDKDDNSPKGLLEVYTEFVIPPSIKFCS